MIRATMTFFRSVGSGIAASFGILAISAVGNGLSTYVLNGQTLRGLVNERFGAGASE